MAFQRKYTREEVQGMLKIFQGNKAFLGFDADMNVQRAGAAAHAEIHGGASYLDQKGRVNTPGEPRMTGTYWTEDDQIDATLEVLNSIQGQLELAKFDLGETRVGINGPLTPGQFRMASAHDDSDKGANQPGHVGRNNAARIGAGATHMQGHATEGFVLLLKGVGGLLQVQTSYPIA